MWVCEWHIYFTCISLWDPFPSASYNLHTWFSLRRCTVSLWWYISHSAMQWQIVFSLHSASVVVRHAIICFSIIVYVIWNKEKAILNISYKSVSLFFPQVKGEDERPWGDRLLLDLLSWSTNIHWHVSSEQKVSWSVQWRDQSISALGRKNIFQ